ncbi:MFS transporter [Mangrovactinospora gilvigrisea]|uniref:MFS transporter n=1 Tax=Mangrovactinospora gilvigrisea TaxID=1428644 RepID=A0A1J7CBZ2_9ACTN|nr:MFS transporter [Mangrovactinospora gilvigrisea]OIV39036.1 MFS transporter [Mangrovactinospora gilvigrisea]
MSQHAAPAPRAGRKEWTGLTVLLLPLLLVSMDVSVLYFAVPFISRDLQPSATQQLWIMDMYGFVLAGLVLTMGAIGDRIGRRRLLMVGAVAFGAASVGAAYSGSAEMLIVMRALLGIGGATLMPSTIALVRNMFHDAKQRATAIAIWTGAMTGGIALGPVLSGLLLEHFWWGSVFLINLPAMAVLLLLVPVFVPEFKNPREGRFDLPGSVLSLGAVLPAMFGIKRGAADGFDAPAWAAIAVGVVVGALFVWRQRTAAHPMVNREVLRGRGFRAGLSVNTVAMFAMIGYVLYTTQYLQLVLGYSPFKAAMWAVLPSVVVGAAAPMAAQVARRFGRSATIAGGFVLGAVGYGLMMLVQADSPLWMALVFITVPSVGIIGVATQVMDLSLAEVAPERAGIAGALMETGQEFGGALGMALLGSLGTAVYRGRIDAHTPAGLDAAARHGVHETLPDALAVAAHLPGRLAAEVTTAARQAFMSGMHVASLGAVTAMLLGAVLTVTLLRRHEKRTADAPVVDAGEPVAVARH